ncbi:hypothetical protein MMC22_005216 [Lobaria immixta]|nr:hypothetical protein [Lobaria immixta]
MDPQSANPASGGHPDAYSGGTAGTGYWFCSHTTPVKCASKGQSEPEESRNTRLVCLYPGCGNFDWLNEMLLDEHMKKEHFEHFATESAAPATTSFRSDQCLQSNQTACRSSAAKTTTTPIDNDAQLNFFHWRPDTLSDSESLPSTQPTKTFACSHEGCHSSFDHVGGLNRHSKKHQDGPREFVCLADGCKRKGNNGFTRLDKLKEHVANRHPFSDFNMYIKGVGWHGGRHIHRFLCWRKARQDWQAKNPSDEMPPWLTDPYPWVRFPCPKCQQDFYYYPLTLVDLKDHWQTKHSSVEMPLWMSIEEFPGLYFI